MSWLSKALGGNTLKIGAVLLGSKFAGEYFFGESAGHGYDISTGSYVAPRFTSGNIFGETLNKIGVTPFSQTAASKSFLGDAIEMFRPGETGGSLLGTAAKVASSGMKMPEAPQYGLNVGTQSFRSGQAFQTGQTQMMNVGRGGSITAALGRDATQQYLARKVAGLRLPSASALPTPMSGTSSIQTTSMRSRGYKKLTG